MRESFQTEIGSDHYGQARQISQRQPQFSKSKNKRRIILGISLLLLLVGLIIIIDGATGSNLSSSAGQGSRIITAPTTQSPTPKPVPTPVPPPTSPTAVISPTNIAPTNAPPAPAVPTNTPAVPTAKPTGRPTGSPTTHPSANPTSVPTGVPTSSPTAMPTNFPPVPSKWDFNFMALGDWGSTPDHQSTSGTNGMTDDRNRNSQVNIARKMGEWATANPIQFVMGHGDSFYWTGIHDNNDYRWNMIFENMYSSPSLYVPWYNVMGNHDYGGGSGFCGPSGPNAGYICGNADELEAAMIRKFTGQRDYNSPHNNRWRLDGHYYKVKHSYPSKDNEEFSVEIFNIDTNAAGNRINQICCQCYSTGQGNCPNPARGGANCINGDTAQFDRCASLLHQWWDESMAGLKRDLKASTATWKIVNSHYLIKFFTPDQQQELSAAMKEGGAHVYFAGHEHAEGHDFIDGIHHFQNGGGGGAICKGGTGNVWASATYGYVAAHVNKYWMQVKFFDDFGNKVWCYNIPIDGRDQDGNGFVKKEEFKC